MRDRPNVKKLDLALWLRGWTPNYHVQVSIFPNAVNVRSPAAASPSSRATSSWPTTTASSWLPVSMAEKVIEDSKKHAEWEVFSREKLMQGATCAGKGFHATIRCTPTHRLGQLLDCRMELFVSRPVCGNRSQGQQGSYKGLRRGDRLFGTREHGQHGFGAVAHGRIGDIEKGNRLGSTCSRLSLETDQVRAAARLGNGQQHAVIEPQA
jgi:hypothetical protein